MPVVIRTVNPRARMRSTSGNTAMNSPTLAPCTHTMGPGGRGALGSPAPFADAIGMLLAALEPSLKEVWHERYPRGRHHPIGAERQRHVLSQFCHGGPCDQRFRRRGLSLH